MKIYYRYLLDGTWSDFEKTSVWRLFWNNKTFTLPMLLALNTKGMISKTGTLNRDGKPVVIELYHPRYPAKSIKNFKR